MLGHGAGGRGTAPFHAAGSGDTNPPSQGRPESPGGGQGEGTSSTEGGTPPISWTTLGQAGLFLPGTSLAERCQEAAVPPAPSSGGHPSAPSSRPTPVTFLWHRGPPGCARGEGQRCRMNNSGQGDKSFLEQANTLIRPNCLPHPRGGKKRANHRLFSLDR